jgi:hypothetical protein
MMPCHLYNPDVDVPAVERSRKIDPKVKRSGTMKKSKDKLGDAFTSFLESQGHKVVDVIPKPSPNKTKEKKTDIKLDSFQMALVALGSVLLIQAIDWLIDRLNPHD